MRRVCVFCGSSAGSHPQYAAQMEVLGHALAEREIELVYGGGRIGLMGVIADAVLAHGGKVTGVIPESITRVEVAHSGLTELMVVKDMHERKATMAQLADGFIAAPGGIGTLEELFEIWTWGQLGLHHKPLGFFDVQEYYRPLHGFLDHMVRQGFVHDSHRNMAVVTDDPYQLLDRLAAFEHPGTIFRLMGLDDHKESR